MKNPRHISKAFLALFIGAFALFAGGVVFMAGQDAVKPEVAHAGGPDAALVGWAWNGYDNNSDGIADAGLGWISFDCSNDNSCASSGGHDYGVRVDTTTGAMSGYAWVGNGTNSTQGNTGWIDFAPAPGPTGHYPLSGGSGTADKPAQINWANGNFSGWARACSVFNTGCSGSLKPQSDRGDWDGWISLRGTGYGLGVPVAGGTVSGYAWGGDNGTGIGAIKFDVAGNPNPVKLVFPPEITSFKVTGIAAQADPFASQTGSGYYTETANISFTATNAGGGCTASGDGDLAGGNWKNSVTSGTTYTAPLSTNPKSGTQFKFTLTCYNTAGISVTETALVDELKPSVSLNAVSTIASPTANGNVAYGGDVNMTWNVSGATACSPTSGPGGWTSKSTPPITSGGPVQVGPLTPPAPGSGVNSIAVSFVLRCINGWSANNVNTGAVNVNVNGYTCIDHSDNDGNGACDFTNGQCVPAATTVADISCINPAYNNQPDPNQPNEGGLLSSCGNNTCDTINNENPRTCPFDCSVNYTEQ